MCIFFHLKNLMNSKPYMDTTAARNLSSGSNACVQNNRALLRLVSSDLRSYGRTNGDQNMHRELGYTPSTSFHLSNCTALLAHCYPARHCNAHGIRRDYFRRTNFRWPTNQMQICISFKIEFVNGGHFISSSLHLIRSLYRNGNQTNVKTHRISNTESQCEKKNTFLIIYRSTQAVECISIE